ncbi:MULTISPECIES: hypothetical protein [unclassified Shinella]|uniref:helix-turn-helix transcriptional regulator n=1 Tax=unclassified Shinella TaxID=2643062 RepID=UPI00225D4CEC|nr:MULTISPECIES: hypothetical protein [unclassified Shinella]MCO5153669.1 hypothetical protein [Shinella sp.]MDC7259926.1 hypothetical protein [Shinella sp. YE25]CAI0341724.1 DNA-binding transcriptional regulator, CsgD family [Rhizobiaceae bacterium]CAK7262041.1 Helix-turn-helix transcriptional regulator [Shinella sp. WSC3-e]
MDLIEQIYEAAALPELWPALLEQMANSLDVAGANFISIEAGSAMNVCSPRIAEGVARYFREGWHLKNDRMQRLIREGHVGFVRDIDLYDASEVAAIPVVRDFYRPLGYGWSAALATPVPTGETFLFSIEQYWERGPLSDEAMARLELLRPHISRAALLTSKLRLQSARSSVEAFDVVGVPAALVRLNGSIVAANESFAALEGQISIGAENRIRLRGATMTTMLEHALKYPYGSNSRRPPLSIAVPGRQDLAPLVLHIVPTEGAARQLFGAQTALLLVTQLVDRPAPDTGLLRALFDFTPMEARVAVALLAGRTSREISMDFGIGSETLKTHTGAVLEKSGFRRRIDFVRFLSGLSWRASAR